MRVAMKYGAGTLELELPDERHAGTWNMRRLAERAAMEPPRTGPELVREALDGLAVAGFADAIRGRHLGILVADATREWSPALLLPPLLERTGEADRLTVFLCSGTHAADSPANLALARTIEGLVGERAQVVVHDSRRHALCDLGATRRGTPVLVNERSAACEAFLVLADMKHHYFAGYSNPAKYFVPGMAGFETARGNHSLALEVEATAGRHPWHPDPASRSNPLSEDLVEAFELVVGARPHFALTMVSEGDELLWAAGDTTRAATEAAIRVVDRVAALAVDPVRFLVVSPGGDPHDESLYTSQRALELSRAALLPGAEVLFLSRCPEGIGPPSARENFYEPLTRPLASIQGMPRDEYVMYGHKPVKFARYLERCERVWMCSDLPPGDVARIHLAPTDDPQAVLDGWLASAGDGDRILFLDDASKISVRSA